RPDGARAGRSGRPARPLPAPALGRPGTTRGDRASAGERPRGAAGRRAYRRPRSQVGGRDIEPGGAPEPRVRQDHPDGDPRSPRRGARHPFAPSRKRRAVKLRERTMNFFSLVLVNLGRNKRRTILTLLSVTVALFLFCSLGGVLDTLQESIRVGSETRLVTRNAISLVFPMPLSYRDRIAVLPGVKSVALQNWFGATDPKNPRNFFAQFGVDDAFFPIYAG